ncbi:serine protease MucD [Azoarcus olearius]|uniref:trypsin-like peptidase domain-containing protein n=1 Tax=Azoarcus sp. (strain BH72) TaxID=418699 RepID=UPI00080638D4|nr:trypsin-like peptidase domain-containing protein [Azoarcus olearius]ANQ84951.1 serine protease MucD [Azoarcus olearius]
MFSPGTRVIRAAGTARSRLAALALCAACTLAGCRPAGEAPDFGALMQTQGPAVVNIVALRPAAATVRDSRPPSPADPAYAVSPQIAAGPEQPVEDLGSGFIIDADGLILTNAHVVAGATSITVRLADGQREYPARLVGADSHSDVALLRIDASGLPVARMGSSASVSAGEWVAAIGSPFGFSNTITAGIVSATGRNLGEGGQVPFIQSDVAVNPGSSGGPLINRRGEVVGVNSMIFSPTGGYLGLSFAIPIEVALDVARHLQRDGEIRRGRLGISVQPLSDGLARAFGFDGQGVLISMVEPGSAAEAAGLRAGDVILGFGGKAATPAALPRMIADSAPGSRQEVALWRDRHPERVTVTMGEHAVQRAAPPAAAAPAHPDHGLVLSALPAEVCRQYGAGFALRVDRAPAARHEDELRYGDVILAVGGRSFTSRGEFDRLLQEAPGDRAALLVRRGSAALFVAVEVPGRLQEAG